MERDEAIIVADEDDEDEVVAAPAALLARMAALNLRILLLKQLPRRQLEHTF